MPGQFDLRHDGDAALGSVGDYIAHFVLRVKPAMRHAVVLVPGSRDDSLLSLRADLGQARMLLDFDAPALIFGQVPVEDVVFVKGQHIDEFLDEFDRKHVSADIKMHTAPAKGGAVVDDDAGQRPVDAVLHFACEYLLRQQLSNRLHAMAETGALRGGQAGARPGFAASR